MVHKHGTAHSKKKRSANAGHAATGTKPTRRKEVILITVLLLVAIALGTFFRMYPAHLPVAEQWAEESVENQVKSNLQAQLQKQYPNLPPEQLQSEVNKQYQQVYEQQEEMFKTQIENTAKQFRSRLQNDDGQTYLLAIDPYFYLRHAQNYFEYGHAGTTYIGGEHGVPEEVQDADMNTNFSKEQSWDRQRLAPIGRPSSMGLHDHMIVAVHEVSSWFGNTDVMKSAFFVPIIISALAIIPAFFIGRMFAGNVGGFFAAALLAVHKSFLTRTVGGFSDTDPYNVLFPLLIAWLFLIAFRSTDLRKKIGFSLGAGLATAVFALVWRWFFIFYIIGAGVAAYLVYLLVVNWKDVRNIFKKPAFVKTIYTGASYLVGTVVFISLFKGISTFWSGILSPFKYMAIKDVATITLWPNIKTTVAELNPATVPETIAQMGGTLLFLAAVAGIVFTVLKKDEDGKKDFRFAFILIAWFAVTMFASTRGIRFNLLLVPAFAVAFGVFAGTIFNWVGNWASKEKEVSSWAAKAVVLVIMAAILIQPISAAHTQARNEIPSMNDAWWETLTKIKEETPEDSIINSWWDFGHQFITVADRRVTFDGGGQDRHMAYWVGRSLATEDEQHAAGILRMVDCGNNNAFYTLNEYLDNDTRESIDTLNDVVVMEHNETKQTLLDKGLTESQADHVMRYTHCDAPQNYYITSEDMVGKSGVWAHFGNWDFDKAAMYKDVNEMSQGEGTAHLQEKFGLDQNKASQTYYDIQSTEANDWIAPWPSFMGEGRCQDVDENNSQCVLSTQQGEMRMSINKTSYELDIDTGEGTVKPESFVYVENGTVKEKEYSGQTSGFSLIYTGDKIVASDPLLSTSTFTRLFYLDGQGSECFEQFDERTQVTGAKISTWNVTWSCLE
ncbi:MAG: STT3 domain-containing protein [Candidatus Woesearchaeota archaeon]